MNSDETVDREESLDEILAAYWKDNEAGAPLDRQALMARHPQYADELAEFFADLDGVEQLAEPLRALREPAAAPLPDNAVTARAPILVPGYAIEGVLGRGGMGVVYRARHVRSQRVVALKMILAGEHAGAEQTARFLAEARAVARLQHPNIVQIHDVGEHDGLPYFSLEYVDGGNLAARLKGAPPSDMEAARLIEILALAVHHAHGRNIVHRDLKPANILLTRDNIPKIADFGLAKILSEDNGATRTGAILGTPSYMSPEQAAGKLSEIGYATDVYALGATLYELLTGRPPFRGEQMQETLVLIAEQNPKPPHFHNPRVDRALEAICLKCLQKSPKDRYASAEELAEDLQRFHRGEAVQAPHGITWGVWSELVRESRYTDLVTRWSPAIMASGICYLFCCVAWFLLASNGIEHYAPYYAVMAAKALSDFALVWLVRIKERTASSRVEDQLLRVMSFFWVLAFLTVWQYQRAGGPVAGSVPILIFEVAFVYGCSAIILGGSFYPTAAAFVGSAVLQVVWPEGGSVALAIGAPALFWVGWKYRRNADS